MNPLTTIQTYVAGAVAALCILIGAALGWYAPWVGGRAQVVRAQDQLSAKIGQLKSAQADLTTCHGNVATEGAKLDEQNAAVRAMGEESVRKTAEANKARLAARAVAESYRVRASAVMAAKPSGTDACAAADALILGSLGK